MREPDPGLRPGGERESPSRKAEGRGQSTPRHSFRIRAHCGAQCEHPSDLKRSSLCRAQTPASDHLITSGASTSAASSSSLTGPAMASGSSHWAAVANAGWRCNTSSTALGSNALHVPHCLALVGVRSTRSLRTCRLTRLAPATARSTTEPTFSPFVPPCAGPFVSSVMPGTIGRFLGWCQASVAHFDTAQTSSSSSVGCHGLDGRRRTRDPGDLPREPPTSMCATFEEPQCFTAHWPGCDHGARPWTVTKTGENRQKPREIYSSPRCSGNTRKCAILCQTVPNHCANVAQSLT